MYILDKYTCIHVLDDYHWFLHYAKIPNVLCMSTNLTTYGVV